MLRLRWEPLPHGASPKMHTPSHTEQGPFCRLALPAVRATLSPDVVEIASRHGLSRCRRDCARRSCAKRRQSVGSSAPSAVSACTHFKTLNTCGDRRRPHPQTTPDLDVSSGTKTSACGPVRTVVWSGNSRLEHPCRPPFFLSSSATSELGGRSTAPKMPLLPEAPPTTPRSRLGPADPHLNPVYHTFVIQADRRDGLRGYLAEQE